jgi:hypothetical protein
MNDLVQVPAAIPLRILDLNADLAEGLADSCKLHGGQMPFGVSRDTAGIEIGALVARRTLHADGTEAACASHHEWLVGMPVVEEGNRSVLLVRYV